MRIWGLVFLYWTVYILYHYSLCPGETSKSITRSCGSVMNNNCTVKMMWEKKYWFNKKVLIGLCRKDRYMSRAVTIPRAVGNESTLFPPYIIKIQVLTFGLDVDSWKTPMYQPDNETSWISYRIIVSLNTWS